MPQSGTGLPRQWMVYKLGSGLMGSVRELDGRSCYVLRGTRGCMKVGKKRQNLLKLSARVTQFILV